MAQGGLWLQQAANHARDLVDFADDLSNAPAGRPGVLFAPVNVPSTLSELYETARSKGDAAVDPSGYLIDRPATKRAEENFPWLVEARPQTQAEWEAWMTQALEQQVDPQFIGSAPVPAFLVTASPQLEAAQGAAGLYPVLDAAAAVRAQAPAECWLGVTIDRDYLREEVHLVRLANALVSSGAPGVVLRCFQTQMPPVTDRRLLEGLAEVVESCASNGIRLFLPCAGWLGWLAMAWGAWGFSGGLAKASWYDRMPTPMTNVPRYESIFESQLLRFVRWSVHEELVQQGGYQSCWCASCAAMGGTYDASEASRHQIRLAHEEAASLRALSRPQRRLAVRQRLDGAIAFRDGLPNVLRTRAQADFLDVWRGFV